jgi:hypothetical protein
MVVSEMTRQRMIFISQDHLLLTEAQAMLADSCRRRNAMVNIIESLEREDLDPNSAQRTLMAINEHIDIQTYHIETLLHARRLRALG